MLLHSLELTCPYCWESIMVEVDDSALPASYIEDCSVCCQPILIDAHLDARGEPAVTGRREND